MLPADDLAVASHPGVGYENSLSMSFTKSKESTCKTSASVGCSSVRYLLRWVTGAASKSKKCAIVALWVTTGFLFGEPMPAMASCLDGLEASLASEEFPSRSVRDTCVAELKAWYESNRDEIIWIFSGVGVALPLALFTLYMDRRQQTRHEEVLVAKNNTQNKELDPLETESFADARVDIDVRFCSEEERNILRSQLARLDSPLQESL